MIHTLFILIAFMFLFHSDVVNAINYDVSVIDTQFTTSPSYAGNYVSISDFPFPKFPNGTFYHNISSLVNVPSAYYYYGTQFVNISFLVNYTGNYYIYVPTHGYDAQSSQYSSEGHVFTNVSIDDLQTITNADWSHYPAQLVALTDINQPLSLTSGNHLIRISFRYAGPWSFLFNKLVLVRPINNYCGDNVCDSTGNYIETYQSCPQDCPNCYDNNPYTYDYYDYTVHQCSHINYACIKNSDCIPSNNYTTGTCINPSTLSSYCQFSAIPNICGNGICENWYGEDCNSCPSDCGCSPGYDCIINITNGIYYGCYASQTSATSTTVQSVTTTTIMSPITTSTSSVQVPSQQPPTTNAPIQSAPSPLPSCPLSCDDLNHCTIDYCNAGTSYQCAHVPVAECGPTNITQPSQPSSNQTQLTINLIIVNMQRILNSSDVKMNLDKSIGLDDLAKINLTASDIKNIMDMRVPSVSIENVNIIKLADNVVYNVQGTKTVNFFFFNLEVPSNVTLNATNGDVISIQQKSVLSVLVDNFIKALFFWVK